MRLRFTVPRGARVLALVTALVAVACGGEDPLAPNEEIAFLVGDWRATRFEVINAADPSDPLDLTADPLNASFTINVQPSGQYTAVMTIQARPFTEIGMLRLDGGQLVQDVERPCCKTVRADYSFEGGILNLYGPTEFDFNQDGVDEAAIADIDLVRD